MKRYVMTLGQMNREALAMRKILSRLANTEDYATMREDQLREALRLLVLDARKLLAPYEESGELRLRGAK